MRFQPQRHGFHAPVAAAEAALAALGIMEDALTLNLNFSDLDGVLSHPKLDWRERKRQVLHTVPN